MLLVAKLKEFVGHVTMRLLLDQDLCVDDRVGRLAVGEGGVVWAGVSAEGVGVVEA